MRWRITIRGKGVELRGYIDAEAAELGYLADQIRAIGIMMASPEADDYDPFRRP